MPGVIVTFKDVDFSYGEAPILESVSFEVESGSFVSVIGPNGGGKTTLVKLMIGLMQPIRGTIRLFGKPPQQSRRRVGYVPQYATFDPQFPITVIDIVLMGRLGRPAGFYTRRDREMAREALETVGLTSASRSQFSKLSGGQRQRVLIARALASEPDILVLDEPTSNVDVAVELRLSTLLEELNRSLTVILITHDLGFASSLVDTLLCVNKRVLIHPTSEVTEDMIRSLYDADVRYVEHGKIVGHADG